jgi:segregation and condensation protein B
VDTETQPLGQNDDNLKAQAQEFPGSMTNEERKAALEAIIYAADEPATIEQLAGALGEEKLAVQASLDELVAGYAAEERGIEIRAVAGGYKLYTKPQHHDLVRRFIKSLRPPLRLTMPALETLAVISYKQPVTAPEIQEIRGVNTSGVIKTLLDKKLITTAGRKEVIGRPILYRTSKEFLMRFGLSDLGELPSLKEFEALAREALGTDEGVAEPGAGDESVLDSMKPGAQEQGIEGQGTEEPGVEELGEDLVDNPAPNEVNAIAAAPSESIEAVASDVNVVAEPTVPPAAEFTDSTAPSTDAIAEPTEHPPTETISSEVANESGISVETPTAEFSEPPQPQQQQMMDTAPEASAEVDQPATEHEISEELLAQLAHGIEVEGSAEMFVTQSGAETPAEQAPAAFYSSDAEPEAVASSSEPMSAAEGSAAAESEQAPSAESHSDQPEENQKSHRAAAGE